MTRLDRYILKNFALTALFATAAFAVIFVAIDMMESLDDFLDHNATIPIIATYYFYFLPEIIKLIIPVAMLLSALFTTGRLSTFNEMTAMKSSGMSLYRFMAPLLIFALLVSGVSVYFNGWVVPLANKHKFAIGRTYFQRNIEYVKKSNIFIADSPTRILSIGMYDDQSMVAYNVSIQDFSPVDPTMVVARYDANQLRWNAGSSSWFLTDGVYREFSGDKEHIEKFTSRPIGHLNFSPDDVRKKEEKPDEMDYNDLSEFIHNQQRAGQDVAKWLVELYGKIAFPFASFIVVLFGVPFSSIKRRGGLGVEFGIAIGICFLYMIFLKVSQAFGYNGDLNPLLTAWLANLIFLGAGIYNLVRVPK
ncbi:MAG TPA: LptF/LptG family permease [Bacteroidota bacterium]|nr:LptF/LptG family permease [Bacteroidota bacterium]